MSYNLCEKAERQGRLRKYYFDCDCKACNDDWKTWTEMANQEMKRQEMVVKV